MSIKTAVATVLKALRRARGLSQKDLAEVSSRTYVSKLERAQSSPTLEMMATLSTPLGVSPLTLVAITIGTETGQPIRSLMRRLEAEVTELTAAGVLKELQIPAGKSILDNQIKEHRKRALIVKASQQTELCFGD
ncbi:hypothetical protein Tco_1414784 [Tanacetum coccineum]